MIMSTTSEAIKEVVKEKYGEIAEREPNACGCGCDEADFINGDYTKLSGYAPEADLGLGCGLPTEFARMKEGDRVLDLGSGAGNDVFIARSVVGKKGQVTGVDMTEKMIAKAKQNAEKLGYENIDFKLGEIEDLPLANSSFDVVVSNCVMNLVPNKNKAFSETFRVLRNGGHFSISDVVTLGEVPARIRSDFELYVGCVSGAIDKEEYLQIIKNAGFKNVQVQKEHKINISEDVVAKSLTAEELEEYKNGKFGVYSITVYAEKPCC